MPRAGTGRSPRNKPEENRLKTKENREGNPFRVPFIFGICQK